MMSDLLRLVTVAVLASGLVIVVPAEAGDTELDAVHIATFDRDVIGVTHAPGDFDRLFVVEKTGRIWVVNDGEILQELFLDAIDIVASGPGGERGLLGLTFHPDYQTNGFFYINYTREPDGDTTVARYQVTGDPNVADPDSAQLVIVVPQPQDNHNAGWLGFGPNDGYLYVAVGDGGLAFDDGDDAQNLDVLLGKILRLDVDGDDFPGDPDRNYAIPPANPFAGKDGADEIWAYGLRNPWRCSFDRETGDFYIGDVGQATWEEIDFQPASSTGGENYGWDCREGAHCTDPPQLTCDCKDATLVDPLFEYPHIESESAAVIGGYVYRGCAIPDLVGAYVFADRRVDLGHPIWQLRHDNGTITDVQEIQDELTPGGGFTIGQISAFGEDAAGEIYFCDSPPGNDLFKIVPANPMEVPADLDEDGNVGTTDLLIVLGAWGTNPGGPPDFNGDGTVDTIDLLILLGAWGPVC